MPSGIRCVIRPRWRLPLAAAFATTLLAGCNVFEGDTAAVVPANCPSVSTLEHGETLTRFAPGSGSGPSAVDVEARLEAGAPSACRIERGTAVVVMPVRISLSRGPASSGSQSGFAYFVAVSDPDGMITAREGFDLDLGFRGSSAEASTVEEVTTRIPLSAGDRLEDYRLILGLQLTREELEYNRQNPR